MEKTTLKAMFEKAVAHIKRKLDRPSFKRHHDDGIIDRVEIVVVPRYKTSGVSGDQWRISAVLRCWRKGRLMVERPYASVEAAAAALPWVLKTWIEGSDSWFGEEENKRWMAFLEEEDWLCHQPGCPESATRVYKLKEVFSQVGLKLDQDECNLGYCRSFCERHAKRGDGGREDSDRNYEPLVGPGPEEAEFPHEDEKPAILGGVIVVDDLDNIGEAVHSAIKDQLKKG